MSSDADLFADILEYREALAMVKEFGRGYNVAIERRWLHIYGSIPYYFFTISKYATDADPSYPVTLWHAVGGGHMNLLEAARLALRQAREQEAANGMFVGLPKQPDQLILRTAKTKEAVEQMAKLIGIVEQDPPGGPGPGRGPVVAP